MKINKILIFHAGGIGDLLLARPAMRLFCQKFSPYSLELLGYPERLALISYDLSAEAIHSIEKSEMAYLYSQPENLPKTLRKFFSSFEVALVFAKSMANQIKIVLEKSGIEVTYFLETFPDNISNIHISDYFIARLKELGICGPRDSRPLQIPNEAKRFAYQFWKEKHIEPGQRILALHPGSGSPAKNWDATKYAKVVDHFANSAKILLVAGPAHDEVNKVISHVKRAKPFLVSNLPLRQLAGLLATCTAYLGNDSGITHLAASLGIPTYAIFGPTDPIVWGPKGERVRLIYTNYKCSPCWPSIPHNCPRPCLNDLKAEEVINMITTSIEFAEQ